MDQTQTLPQPIRDAAGATDPGPRNVMLDRANPDLIHPPELVQQTPRLDANALRGLKKTREPVL